MKLKYFNSILLILLITININSCSYEESKSTLSEEEIREQKRQQAKRVKDSLNETYTQQLIQKYQANANWDSTDNFTYILQEKLETTTEPIAFFGIISDVIKNDTLYIIKLSKPDYPTSYIAEISVNPNMFQKLRNQINSYKSKNEGCFIINVSSISSTLPKIKSGDDKNSTLTLDIEETLIEFRGSLIDSYIYEKE